jgi:hypothetical protein
MQAPSAIHHDRHKELGRGRFALQKWEGRWYLTKIMNWAKLIELILASDGRTS